MCSMKRLLTALFIFSVFFPFPALAGYPLKFEDAASRIISIEQPPKRVISIVPAVTEILFRIGVGDAVAGVTHHDTYPPQAATKAEIGGFFSPSLARIEALKPDVIFVSNHHEEVVSAYTGNAGPSIIELQMKSVADLNNAIALLGEVFDREKAAGNLLHEIQSELSHTKAKVSAIPGVEKKRVLRLMGRNRVMTPGDDSFQNEFIRLAGGIPPKLGKNGAIVPVTLEAWQAFNPQILYGCGGDREAITKMLDQPGWRDVEAVKNGTIKFFPCDLTCRLSSRTGYFVSCLAAAVYGDKFASLPHILPDEKLGSKSIPLPLRYVAKAEVVDSRVNDYTHKTLLIHFDSPMQVASTLEGFREQIRVVGNSYAPPQVWGMYHYIGLEASRRQLLSAIQMERKNTGLLFTGANMGNLTVQKQQYKEMIVYALVTAGVKSNAVRMAEDVGRFYEPGTINMVILSNMQLTPRALNRAIISATEAKTAALQDLDIRSAYTPADNPATGTGTDNIIVVEGKGPRIDNAGGHSKMGELIAKAVYAGVKEATFQQNGLIQRRSVFHRLKERKISLFGLVDDCTCGIPGSDMTTELERLLLEPEIAGFVEASLAISDHYERKLVSDLSGFESWCNGMTTFIAGKPGTEKRLFEFSEPMPHVLKMAFEALLNGIVTRHQGR